MRENRSLAQQAIVFVNIEITASRWKELCNLIDFRGVFGEVRVHPDIGVLAGQLAGGCQLCRAGSQREAWRDGVTQATIVVPALDQLLAVAVPGDGIVTQPGRTVAVHQDLAGDESHVMRQRRFENRVRGMCMHGAEHQGRRRAVQQQLVDKSPRNLVELREMHVTVDETGHDQFAGQLGQFRVGTETGHQLCCFARSRHDAVVDEKHAVVEIFAGGWWGVFARIRKTVQYRGAKRLPHGIQSASSRTTSSSNRSSQLSPAPPRSRIRN